jgi:hypothetical protein
MRYGYHKPDYFEKLQRKIQRKRALAILKENIYLEHQFYAKKRRDIL